MFSFRQQHFSLAVIRYDQALRADPLDRQIIDNIAEMFHALPPGLNLPEVRALAHDFARQDMALQQILVKQNLNRWGARWVTTIQLQQIHIAEKKIEGTLSQLEADQEQIEQQIASWDQQIANDVSDQQLLVTPNAAIGTETSGAVYSQTYYDLQRDIVDLKYRRQTAALKLGDIAVAMRATQSQLPIQPFTGAQQIIGEEGTPIAPPKAATQPSTNERAMAL